MHQRENNVHFPIIKNGVPLHDLCAAALLLFFWGFFRFVYSCIITAFPLI